MSIAPACSAPSACATTRRGVRRDLVRRHRRDEHEVDVERVDAGVGAARGGRRTWRRSVRRSSGSARRRDLMPVRLTIQASSTPMRSAIGPFGTTSGGTWWPSPRIVARARRAPRVAVARRLAGDRGELGRERGATHGRAPRPGSRPGSPGRMRLPRRASTLPGPTSTKRRAPASCMASTVSRQRTGRVKTSASSARTSVERLRRWRDEKTGNARLVRARSRRARRGTARRPAPSLGEWNAPATSSGSDAAAALAARPPRPLRARRAGRRGRPGRGRCRWRR